MAYPRSAKAEPWHTRDHTHPASRERLALLPRSYRRDVPNRSGVTTAPSTASIEQSVISAAETSAIVITSLVSGTACPDLQFMFGAYLFKISPGACPALSFLVGPYTVTVSSATLYEGGMCTDIKPQIVSRLSETKQSDDHVLASRVSFPD
jgi:hypothetical protein